MYAIQALWTAAHVDLPIVFVILANREYRVLKHNIDVYRQRFGIASQEPYAHMDLGGPRLGFVEMAAGMGVAGDACDEPATRSARRSRPRSPRASRTWSRSPSRPNAETSCGR